MQEVIVHLITDRVSITIRRVDVICDESKSLFCQDGFARTGRDVIIRIDRILQVRCKNGIDIVAAIFDIVGTNLAIDINQSLRRTMTVIVDSPLLSPLVKPVTVTAFLRAFWTPSTSP